MGLFGVAGRDNQKIMQRQNQLMGPGIMNLLGVIKKGYGFYGNKWVADQSFLDLFEQMFNMHPGKRISPEEILEHDFLASTYGYDLNAYGTQDGNERNQNDTYDDEEFEQDPNRQ